MEINDIDVTDFIGQKIEQTYKYTISNQGNVASGKKFQNIIAKKIILSVPIVPLSYADTEILLNAIKLNDEIKVNFTNQDTNATDTIYCCITGWKNKRINNDYYQVTNITLEEI